MMMKCGCAAQGTCSGIGDKVFDPPIPACITHNCFEVAETPSLSGRTARCTYHGKKPHRNECPKCRNKQACACEEPSSPDLAFFVFQGEGSQYATEICVCGMHQVAHQKKRGEGGCKCQTFVPQGPATHDRYYCGCMSWD